MTVLIFRNIFPAPRRYNRQLRCLCPPAPSSADAGGGYYPVERMLPIFPEMPIAAAQFAAWREAAAAIAAALAAGSILLGLWNYRPVLAQTTLVWAAWWSAAAAGAIAGVELARAAFPLADSWLAPLRFCAAALSFCPFVAVLGAKRPQHLAWNFVVLSLWGIVSLSALTALVMQRSDRFILGDARAWLLWVLILMGLINYLPTRNWLTALLVALGQVILFAPHLPLLRGNLWLANLPAGPSLALFVLAIAVAVTDTSLKRKRRTVRPRDSVTTASGRKHEQRFPSLALQAGVEPVPASNSSDAFDRLWLDFRDSFGLLWGLRLQERVNAASTAAKWEVELQWQGFGPKGIPAKHREALRQAMTGLLRRFVSHEWIAARLEKNID